MPHSLTITRSDFLTHLTRTGALRDHQLREPNPVRRREGQVDVDWLGLTKLTPAKFVEELAAFYGCARVDRGELLSHRFAGGQLSPRFLREGRFLPYETSAGAVMLAIATPLEADALRAL